VARLTEAWQAGAGRIGAVHSAMQRLESDGSVSDYPPLRPLLDPLNPQDMITREFHLIGASMGWDRKLFDVFGPLPPDTLIEDRPLAFRAALLGGTAWVDEPLLLYRAGGASDPGTLARERRQPLRRRHHVRRQRWRRSHLIAYLRDMDIVAPPEAEECRRLCEERLTLLDLELGLADAGLAGRLGQAGQALALAARRRDPAALRILAKYLADGLRYRQGPAAAG